MKYYSETLKKIFDTEDELRQAEEKEANAIAEQKKLKEVRSARAQEVIDAYDEAAKAYKSAQDKLNKFIEDYGSFRYAKTSTDKPLSMFDVFFSNPFFF